MWMLAQDGTISFGEEIMGLVDQFLQQYEEREGPFRNELEKGLVISYALGCIKQDAECVWNTLSQAAVFRNISPRGIYEECTKEDSAAKSELLERLRSRRWLEI
jgi:hypothetical protein